LTDNKCIYVKDFKQTAVQNIQCTKHDQKINAMFVFWITVLVFSRKEIDLLN